MSRGDPMPASSSREKRPEPRGGRKKRRNRRRSYLPLILFVIAASAVIVITAALAAGNSSAKSGSTSGSSADGEESVHDAIHLRKDGSLTVTSDESFDQDYYSEDELSSLIDSSIASYNETAGKDSVIRKELKVSAGKAHLVMEYASAEDFASFNETPMYYGTVNGASMSGLGMGDLIGKKRIRDDSKELSSEELGDLGDNPVIVLYYPCTIRTDRKMLYCSDNVTAESKKSAVIADTASENEPAFIILK